MSRRGNAAALGGLLALALPASVAAQGPPNPPVNLEADLTSERVRLTWDRDDSGNRRSAVFFRVYRNGDYLDSSDDQVHTDYDVRVGEQYTYEVSGVDFLGREGNRSQPLTLTIPDDTPPDKPEDLVAEAVSESRIELRWEAVRGDDDDDDDRGAAAGYYIYRNGGSTPHDSTSESRYSDTGLSAFTEYAYRVSAVNISGVEGEKSDEASARTFDGSPPTAPDDLTANAVSSSAIELDWEAASDSESGILRYYIYRDGGSAPIDSTTSTRHTDDGLEGGGQHAYEVAAMNGAGLIGPRSNTATATLADDSPPDAPAALTAEATSARSVELSWSAATDPESGISIYLVYRDGESSPLDSTTALTYTDGSVVPETDYSYRVSARNGEGLEGPTSASAAVTTPAATDDTPPSTPADFTATAPAPGRVELSWSAAEDPESGVDAYSVYRNGALLGTSPGAGFVDLTVEPLTSYEYEVAAVNGDGLEGARTAAVEVTTPGSGEEEEQDTVPPAPPTGLRVVTG